MPTEKNNITKSWMLQDALYQLFHQWPQMIAFFLLGGLIGWGLTFIIPKSFSATSHIYVALNPYRAFADTTFLAIANPKFSNVDDYKNWQMEQLENVIFIDEFISETLNLLRQQDPYWQTIDIDTLRTMLDANWRSAGEWSLIATSKNPKYAEQAAKAWAKVSLAKVEDAIKVSQSTVATNEELRTVANQKIYDQTRIEELKKAEVELNNWVQELQQMPTDKPISPLERWKLLASVTSLSSFDTNWLTVLNQQPEDNATPKAYIEWLEKIQFTIQQEINKLETDLQVLEKLQVELSEKYAQESDGSLGLSPNLVLHGIDNKPAEPNQMTNLFTLIGGFTGLLGWIFYELILITKKVNTSE